MIPLDKCKDGYLYIIYARNAWLGIFTQEQQGFKISRFKGFTYEFVEYHWDIGEPYGTVRPYKELFKPDKLTNESEFLHFMKTYFQEHKEEIRQVLIESIKEDDGHPSQKFYLKFLAENELNSYG